MRLLFPGALLLLIPTLFLVWKTGRLPGPPLWLRLALVGLLVLAISGPEVSFRSAGSDLVVVVDRSRSMPPGSEGKLEELIRLIEPQRRPGDRVGVVAFGREARLELPLTDRAAFGGFTRALDSEASDLGAALDAAGELVPAGRAARVLVVSDGRSTGLDPRAAARRLAARGIPVDHRWLGREEAGLDVAVVGLEVPPAVAAREPFALTATLHASAGGSGTVTLRRDGKRLLKGQYSFRPGDNLLSFRDLVEAPGLATYELSLEAAGDGVVENDVGRAVLRVEGPPRVLLITAAASGTLRRTLTEAGLNLEVRAPFPLTLDALDGVGAVVLENIEAGSLSEGGLSVLADYVKEAGGGLVMTGGRKSFGEGGYRKSKVEDLLPVSLEVREEQRKSALALSIIMDCSCSMGATIDDGRTKMELAAEGVVGALELLNESDEASVDMVDTAGHSIFSMSPVGEGLPLGKVARGFSGGGGIFIGEGLRVAQQQILRSDKPTRHVLLFADASDSEEPDDYQRTLAQLAQAKVSVSVIAMGSRDDSDAALLEEVARRGAGRIYFAEDVTSLPRIFSQETIAVARATFVDTPTALEPAPDRALLGKLPLAGTAPIGGYNLTYLKPQAGVAFRSSDDNQAPVLALWQRGAGRVAAYTGEVDGQYTGAMRHAPGYRSLLEQMVRWTSSAQPLPLDAVPRSIRQGSDLHVTVDFDRRQPPPEAAATLVLLRGDGQGPPIELPMRWEDEDRMGAHYSLPGSGTFHPVVRLGNRVLRAPPVSLPYAPEFEPSAPSAGKSLLAEISRAGGGLERRSMAGLFTSALESYAPVPLAPVLVGAAVLGLLAEVVLRRLRPAPTPKVPGPAPVEAARPGARSAAPSAPEGAQRGPADPPRVEGALDLARERARKRLRR